MRVYVRGKQRTWWGDWWETGPDGERVRQRESLALHFPEHDQAAALEALRLRTQQRTLQADASRPSLEPLKPTLDEIFAGWLRSKRILHQAKPRTIEAIESASRRFSREWGSLLAHDLTPACLDDFKEARMRSVSPATLNRDLDMLRNALRWAKQRGHIEVMPLVERVRSRRRDVPKLLGTEQVRALLTLCTAVHPEHGTRFQRLEPVVRVALAAGLRAEETRWLAWSDIDLDRDRLTVTSKPGWSPKSSSERAVPLHDGFIAWIQRWHAHLTGQLGRRLLPGDWFAPFLPVEQGRGGGQGVAGQQWVRGVLGQEVRRLFTAAGIPPTGKHHLHKLRGTFATRVLEGGGSIEALRQLLGHTDLRTTALYLEATDQVRRRAVLGAGWDE
jgi:integrase/recombinase XerD